MAIKLVEQGRNCRFPEFDQSIDGGHRSSRIVIAESGNQSGHGTV
jgi:hypothetical protein